MTVAVIIPVFNARHLLGDTLTAVSSGRRKPDELIVVDDGSSDDSAEFARQFGARVVVMPRNVGPAACRNHAALLSSSDVLIFLDADTCVHSDTIERMESQLQHESLDAVIGSYDDTPRDPGICSQYRNLAHCYVHHSANRIARTFWSGCGAVRRTSFMEAGGFDERFLKPSVEDIEFGYRMSDRGAHILLDTAICVTHTKHWTVWNSITTDIFSRGMPWMLLLMERGSMPNDLNVTRCHRVTAALTLLSLICLAACSQSLLWLVLCVAFAVTALSLDAGLLKFMFRKGGLPLLACAAWMTLLQNLCKVIATAAASVVFASSWRPLHHFHRGEQRSRVLEHQRMQAQQQSSSHAAASSAWSQTASIHRAAEDAQIPFRSDLEG